MRYLPSQRGGKLRLFALSLVFSLPGGALVSEVQAQEFERAPTLNASAFVPQNLLSGQSHQVDQLVHNDGYMNRFTIQSKFGVFEAHSNAELGIRVHEINAIAAMEHIKAGKGFVSGVGAAGGQVIKGAGNLITNPVGAVQGTFSGIGKLFQRGADTMAGKGNEQDGMLTGKSKRKYAQEFGVDPYSTNLKLQQRLNELAGAQSVGSLSASAALMFVGGGAGVAISVTKGTQTLNEASRQLPATDLRRLNREHLLAIGVSPGVADLFLDQDALTPTNQARIVDALDSMSTTADRAQFVKFAVHTKTEDEALFRQRQAQMYAAYHQTIAPIVKFLSIGTLTMGQTANGTLVFNVPLDYLVWTPAMAQIVEQATALVGGDSRELWMTGSASELARSALTSRGWKVQENTKLISVW